ncbi:MAG: hypothetical protein IPI04_16200 [Ignavibacteria bacterium]|nr:hypothetical protein [Ignavibacteria bacterium]
MDWLSGFSSYHHRRQILLKESGLWTWVGAGARYFFSPTVAGVAGFGFGIINLMFRLGVDFKF